MPRRCLFLLIASSLAAFAAAKRSAPEFSVQFPDGKSVTLAGYQGKPLVLEVILTTCSHCQRVSRVLEGILQEHQKSGLQVLAVAINDNPDIAGFVKSQQVTFPVGTSPRDPVYRLLRIGMGRIPMPQLLLIDKAGTIVAQYGGDSPLLAEGQDDSGLKTAIDNLVKFGVPAAQPAPSKGNPKK